MADAAKIQVKTALAQLDQMHTVIAQYRQASAELPRDPGHLGILVRMHAQTIPVARGVPIDPWGNPYVYRTDSAAERGYRLYTVGKNGVDDAITGDDVVSRAQVDVKIYPEVYEGALQLFPLVVMVVLAPILFAALRAAKRATQ